MLIQDFIDLFCGMGGFRIALERLNLKCAFSCDIDPVAQKTYKVNFGEEPSGNIRKVVAESVPAHDILCGGPPCQSFSIAGKKKGFSDKIRGTLFEEVVRIAKFRQPKALILENVKNLVSHDGGNTLKVILEALGGIGYFPVQHKILNASSYGAATSRERVYIVAFRRDLGVGGFAFPSPTPGSCVLRDFLLPDDETSQYVVNREFEYRKGIVVEDGLFGDYSHVQFPVRIGNLVGMTGQGCRVYSDLGHAVTITRAGGGVGRSTGLYLINGKVRRLAPRECARIMGFPDSFVLPESDRDAYALLGNSVVVPVVELVAKKVLEALHKKHA
jgi:DNA (cytosine-5)-methyltransferase 1